MENGGKHFKLWEIYKQKQVSMWNQVIWRACRKIDTFGIEDTLPSWVRYCLWHIPFRAGLQYVFDKWCWEQTHTKLMRKPEVTIATCRINPNYSGGKPQNGFTLWHLLGPQEADTVLWVNEREPHMPGSDGTSRGAVTAAEISKE